MPKNKVPILRQKRLTFWDEYEKRETVLVADIVAEAGAWVNWLKDDRTISFRFIGPDERSVSVNKEPRPYFEREGQTIDIWYAYKTINRRRKRYYLGKSENVSYKKLREAVAELYSRLSTT